MKRFNPFLFLLFYLQPFLVSGQITPVVDSNQSSHADKILFQTQPDTIATQSLKEEAETIRKIRGVPGMAYAVFSKERIIDFQVLGYRVFKMKDHIDINDRFNIGTNTAAFTAYIAAKLVEAGKIKWNTPLLKIFPEFSKKTFPVYKTITFQDLLSSRTRIPPFMDMSEWFKIPNYPGNIRTKRKSFTYWMLQHKPNMENFLNEKIVFSLAGYIMAASMMEKVTGKSWEDLVLEYIRTPLKISMRYSWPNITDPSAPAGHWVQGGSFHSEEPETWIRGNPVLYPGQAISISMPDYIKYMQMSLQGLAGEKTKLSYKDFDFLYFGLLDYALGWNNGSFNDEAFAFHEGLSLLFNCRTEILKEKNIGIIVMCNSGDKDGRGAVLDITRLLEEKYF
jgi:D-alanyl-D-alanine carboxypeptidase